MDHPTSRDIARVFPRRNLTIATAESCSAGLAAYLLATVPGSSAYLLGGVVAYSNELKRELLDVPAEVLERYGAVSRECALAMARGVRARTGATIGVATTGIAGPTGATPTKPVGLVYVACASPWGDVWREHRWDGDRHDNMRRAADAALRVALEQALAHAGDEAS